MQDLMDFWWIFDGFLMDFDGFDGFLMSLMDFLMDFDGFWWILVRVLMDFGSTNP
jgi:hypothetical protein